MRIIAGEWRGRAIKAPKGKRTRPTTDRVREAVFSAITARLGPDLGAGSALDAFAGSGAMGLEALSRGISSTTFVESDREALPVLRDNVSALGAKNRATILASSVFSLAGCTISGAPFSLILLDPPYTLDAAKTSALLTDLLFSGQVVPGTLVVWEHLAGQMPPWPLGYELVARKRYGSTEVDIGVCEGGSEPA